MSVVDVQEGVSRKPKKKAEQMEIIDDTNIEDT